MHHPPPHPSNSKSICRNQVGREASARCRGPLNAPNKGGGGGGRSANGFILGVTSMRDSGTDMYFHYQGSSFNLTPKILHHMRRSRNIAGLDFAPEMFIMLYFIL